MYPDLSLYIDGEFISGQGRIEQDIINPATGQVLGKLPHASTADLDRALAAADRAFASWRHSSPMERSAVLRKVGELARERADDIGRNLTLDQGKPLAEAILEIRACSEHTEWAAEEARRIYGRVIPPRNPQIRQLVLREPVGVCAAFTPWNFPFNQAIRKVAYAIAAGCTIILKGPEDTPSALIAIAQLFHDAGLPPGVLNLVWGVPNEISTYLIQSPIVRKISFTGSVPVGKQLASMAGAHMKRVTMELGGHSPVIVFDDADIDQAASLLARSKIRNAGQVCISPTRFYIQEGAYARFAQQFTEALAAIKVGDGLETGVEMGPLAHARRVDAMNTFIQDAQQRGGEILLGGTQDDRAGNFFPPTVVANLPDDARLMTEEPFGPVAPLTTFKTIEEVLQRANSLPFGLASYVFTERSKTAHLMSNGLEAGMVSINHFGLALAETPFGGVKDSGIGSEGGSEALEPFLTTKFVTQI